MANEEPKKPAKKSDRKVDRLGDQTPQNWQFWLWYGSLTLLLLWMWQDMFYQMRVKTIPYSQFKQYLAADEVTEAEILDTEIVGKVVPKKIATEAPKKVEDAKAAPKTESTVAKSAEKKEEKKGEQTAIGPPAKDAKVEATKPATKEGAKEEAKEESPTEPFIFRTVRVTDEKLIEELEAKKVVFTGVRPSLLGHFIWAWMMPLVMIAFLSLLVLRLLRPAASESVLSFAKSRAKLVADKDTGVTFNDVAGCDEAKVELYEVVDFLSNAERYEALGAKIPKGVLLVGPPGTGKTLLARAVAGEAKVPFFSMSGSDFVEMFVGVGAARVRDLFQQAKQHAPCIIFIDEMDAIGRQRGVHVGTVNDEREQTLNQLLVEMDGFEANVGVIILAATNRPEVLDRALLRPGRFDRQVIIDAPDVGGREAILRVHARDKKLADDVDLRRVAQGTPGFSGADLANALNEAAILAARVNHTVISQKDLEDAVEKVVAGPERKSRRLNDVEKTRVAYHEVGHALVATYSKNSDPLHKISIVPRGRAALGYTMHLPADEQFLMSKTDLMSRIRGLLGGRAAEDVVYGEVTTGAENDLERATAMVQQMICMFGMGESAGLLHVGQRQNLFLPGADGTLQRDCSPEMSRIIDEEMKRILDATYAEAKDILIAHRDQLERIARQLLVRETIDAKEYAELLNDPSVTPDTVTADASAAETTNPS